MLTKQLWMWETYTSGAAINLRGQVACVSHINDRPNSKRLFEAHTLSKEGDSERGWFTIFKVKHAENVQSSSFFKTIISKSIMES